MTVTLDATRLIAADSRWLATFATTRDDGSVHASLVSAGVVDDPVTGEPCVGAVVGASARKLVHLRRSGRATATFHAGWTWVSVEGPVTLAGPDDDAGLSAAAVADLLRSVFQAAGGTHADWDEFDRAMVAERRTAVLIHPRRIMPNH